MNGKKRPQSRLDYYCKVDGLQWFLAVDSRETVEDRAAAAQRRRASWAAKK